MNSKQSYDVVIVGAGVIGLACAYALQQAGASVCVLEQHLPGAGQSTRTGGGIRFAHGSALNVELARLSLPVWRNFASLFGVDPQFHEVGHLFLSRKPQSPESAGEQATQSPAYCGTTRSLDAAAVRTQWPQIASQKFATADYCESGGYLNHFSVIQGYLETLLRNGVEIRLGARIEGLLMDGKQQRVCGVRSNQGDFTAALVVNAAGAGAGVVAGFAGLSIPFLSRRHELLIVRADISGPDDIPWLIDVDQQVHLRPNGNGRALVGGFLGRDEAVDTDYYSREYDKTWADEVRLAAANAFGLTDSNSEILEGWAGLYPGTTDYLPVVELSLPGLITAAGLSGIGLMHAPAIGDIVNILAQGKLHPVIDISSLAANRFKTPGKAQERTGF